MSIKYDGSSFIINGKRTYLYGGDFHYFRTPKTLWEDRIRKIADAGCNLVSTPIPWNWHEVEDSKFEWKDQRDMRYFLDLCQKYNLHVIIKPGPYICAELDFGGLPDWLLGKDLIARSLNDEYMKHVERWFKKVFDVIRPYLHQNGGNIIAMQIENEYGHLKGTEYYTSDEAACEYMRKLVDLCKRANIHLPYFTNESPFIRGRDLGLIEMITFYPNIPGLWMWEFDVLEGKLLEHKKIQLGAPVGIIELQAGWFQPFGFPEVPIPAKLTDLILKDCIVRGASLLNVYMLVGGTSTPYWPSRGSWVWPMGARVNPNTVGLITSFDFGGAPIHEWGELGEKYPIILKHGTFINTYSDLLIRCKQNRSAKFVELNTKFRPYKREPDVKKNTKIVYTSCDDGGFLFVCNLDDYSKQAMISYKSSRTGEWRRLPFNGKLRLLPKHGRIMPLDIKLDDLLIVHSTSEVLAHKKLGDTLMAFFYGPLETDGELVLDTSFEVEVLEGDVQITRKDGLTVLNYTHSGTQIVRSGKLMLVIIDEEAAGNFYVLDDMVMLTDVYRVKRSTASTKSVRAELKPGEHTHTRIFLPNAPQCISIDNQVVPFTYDKRTMSAHVYYTPKLESPIFIEWDPRWYFIADDAELMPNYDDSEWADVGPKSLESLGYFDHGWYYYRVHFDMLKASKARIVLDTGVDRAYVYLNGKFLWKGIGRMDVEAEIPEGHNVIAIRYENAYHNKAHPSEGEIMKYSGIRQPVKIKARNRSLKLHNFKLRYGLGGQQKRYPSRDVDIKGWYRMEPSEELMFQAAGEIVWARREFNYHLKDGYSAPLKLRLPYVSDRCIVYLNGNPIGKYENVGPQHDFYIPEPLLQERNVLVLCIEGPGGKSANNLPKSNAEYYDFSQSKGRLFTRQPSLSEWYSAKEVSIEIK